MQMTGWSNICQLFAIPRFFERIYRLTIRERLTLELALRESEVDAAKNYICQHSLAELVKQKKSSIAFLLRARSQEKRSL